MFGIYFILAAEVGCPRCINNAQTHLIDAYDMSAEEVDAYFDFENADSIPDNEKAVLRFTKKSASAWKPRKRTLPICASMDTVIRKLSRWYPS